MDAIKNIIIQALSSAVRHGIVALGVLAATHHIPFISEASQNDIAQTVVGCLAALAGYFWSVYRSNKLVKQKEDAVPPSVKASAAGGIVLFLAFMSAALMGCAVIGNFDQNTYSAALALKSDSLALMAKSKEPASTHKDEIDALKVRLTAQLAYEQGKGKSNVISATQWNVIISPDRDLLGGYLKWWENGKPVSTVFLTEKSQQVSDAFDQVLKLEGAKNR